MVPEKNARFKGSRQVSSGCATGHHGPEENARFKRSRQVSGHPHRLRRMSGGLPPQSGGVHDCYLTKPVGYRMGLRGREGGGRVSQPLRRGEGPPPARRWVLPTGERISIEKMAQNREGSTGPRDLATHIERAKSGKHTHRNKIMVTGKSGFPQGKRGRNSVPQNFPASVCAIGPGYRASCSPAARPKPEKMHVSGSHQVS